MSRHPSLKSTGKIRKKRNVLKRFERIDLLKVDGRWTEGKKVLNGLPKTKSVE
jgi:small basic protein (TIGR04137 family)